MEHYFYLILCIAHLILFRSDHHRHYSIRTSVSQFFLASKYTYFCSVILTIRAWAIWGRNERLGIAVSIFSVASIVTSYVTLALFLRGEQCKLSFMHNAFHISCPLSQLATDHILTGLSRTVYINWVILMIFEAGKIAQ